MTTKLRLLFALSIFLSLEICAQVNFTDNAPCTTAVPSSASFTDWRVQNYTIYTVTLGTQTVELPFYNTNLSNPNINEFSQYTLKDYEPGTVGSCFSMILELQALAPMPLISCFTTGIPACCVSSSHLLVFLVRTMPFP